MEGDKKQEKKTKLEDFDSVDAYLDAAIYEAEKEYLESKRRKIKSD